MNDIEYKSGFQVLGSATWRDLLPPLPRPVWAFGGQRLYRVLIEGSGFSLPVVNAGEPMVGLFTTRFVAAASVREAETKARTSVLLEWKRRGYEAAAGTSPLLRTESIAFIEGHVRLRSGAGFTFFNAPEDPG